MGHPEEPEWVQDWDKNWNPGLGGLKSLCADGTGWGRSQARCPDEEVWPEGDRISKHSRASSGKHCFWKGVASGYLGLQRRGVRCSQAVVVPESCGWKRFGSGSQIGVGCGACGR